jgi:hypothetical protein
MAGIDLGHGRIRVAAISGRLIGKYGLSCRGTATEHPLSAVSNRHASDFLTI